MEKRKLINRDYKSLMQKGISRKRHSSLYIFIGTGVLLISALYFKSATSMVKPIVSNTGSSTNNIISIPLPEQASSSAATPPFGSNKQQQTSTIAPHTPYAKGSWSEYIVKAGDNLSKIFKKKGLSASTLHGIIHSNEQASALKNIKPGQTVRFLQDSNTNLLALEYAIDRVKTLRIKTSATGFNSEITEKPVRISHLTASGTINNSLFYDAKQAGLTDRTIMELANIFGWDIDFAQNLRQGDSFSLLYESKHIGQQRIENGRILAAEFINRGETFQAVRFVDKNGHAEYFSPEGKSMRKTFLRNPIDFARVSSHFNLRRKHPVLNRIRAHKGVDYAASRGTPIKSTGDGRITYRGVKGGYGRVVIVQHGQKYSSLYAHMSKYGRYKKGAYVKQGQVIGYVGKSGLATGAHLHYEFRINGVHRNPLTAKFPSAKPINKNLLASFKQQTSPLLAQLSHAKQTQLALKPSFK